MGLMTIPSVDQFASLRTPISNSYNLKTFIYDDPQKNKIVEGQTCLGVEVEDRLHYFMLLSSPARVDTHVFERNVSMESIQLGKINEKIVDAIKARKLLFVDTRYGGIITAHESLRDELHDSAPLDPKHPNHKPIVVDLKGKTILYGCMEFNFISHQLYLEIARDFFPLLTNACIKFDELENIKQNLSPESSIQSNNSKTSSKQDFQNQNNSLKAVKSKSKSDNCAII